MLKAIEEVSVEEGGSSKDIMWIDGESNNNLERGKNRKEGEERVKEANQAGKVSRTSAGNYKVGKTWKRLGQEVSKRKPLAEIGTKQNELEIGKKRKNVCGGGQVGNQRELESKKKARLIEWTEDVLMLSEVVEPSLNGAPKLK